MESTQKQEVVRWDLPQHYAFYVERLHRKKCEHYAMALRCRGACAYLTEHPYTPLMQSRRGVRPVNTEARVGEQTVPEECESCISTEPFRAAHSAIRGVFAVPPFHLKSAHLSIIPCVFGEKWVDKNEVSSW